MEWLLEPFAPTFMRQALLAGVLVAVLCGLAGSWLVLRGLTFLGEALPHGLLPGVAIAALLGVNVLIGAAAAAVLMAVGIGWANRRSSLPDDTGIGLLFIGMLSIGVVIVSRSRTFATDLTDYLFGDLLGTRTLDLIVLGAAGVLALFLSVAAYRRLLVLSIDERKAAALGLRPGLAHAVLLTLVTLAVVTSFQAVGTILVFGLLVAPPATAAQLSKSVPAMIVSSIVIGILLVVVGLFVSWHLDTAAGATVATLAVATFLVVTAFAGRSSLLKGRRKGVDPAYQAQ